MDMMILLGCGPVGHLRVGHLRVGSLYLACRPESHHPLREALRRLRYEFYTLGIPSQSRLVAGVKLIANSGTELGRSERRHVRLSYQPCLPRLYRMAMAWPTFILR